MATVTKKTTETPRETLTPDEKMERRFAAWLATPGIQFVSPEAEAEYKARITRIIDAIQLKKTPDRVPVLPRFQLDGFPAAYCGYTPKDMWYDVDKAIDAATRCTLELQFDVKIGASAPQGRVYEILEDKQRKWPGHGVADDGGMQFIEGEYMKADEYDAFILDESDFRLRTYLPRTWGAAEPLKQLVVGNVRSFGLPEVQAALRKLMEAGDETRRWEGKIAAANKKLTELGFPSFGGPAALGGAPFDQLGDNLRGQRGIVMDMFRQPQKLLEALDILTRKRLLRIRQSSANVSPGSSPIVGFALHKGADGFMSDEQFRTFYWPSLRQICLALIEEGFVPQLRAQGGYNSRLEAIRDLPPGKVIWCFSDMDMERAKEVLGDIACLQGNVPLALINTGTPEQTADYCRRLIDTAGKDGGFILDTSGSIDNRGKVENVRAMIRCAKEDGVYS
ncbi:MAG: uroporphyrinogen decarboxylase family protein [Chloroflexota bacterium]